MRAYVIAMFLITFNLSLPVLNGLGVFGQVSSNPIPETTTDPGSLISNALGVVGGLAVVGGVILRLNIGAIIFASVFAITALPLKSTVNAIAQPYMVGGAADTITAAVGLVTAVLAFVFVYAFIQLSGVYTGD